MFLPNLEQINVWVSAEKKKQSPHMHTLIFRYVSLTLPFSWYVYENS